MYLQQIMPHKRLHPQSQKRKQHKAAQNMSKVNNKDTKMTPLTSLWCHSNYLQMITALFLAITMFILSRNI